MLQTSRKRRLPFRYLEPAFFGGLLDDPLLFIRIRPLRRAILFDCGQMAHLAKRVVKPIDTVFISHAHMDHLMGFSTLIRHNHTSPRHLDIFGPPGITDRVHHLLMGYDWNLSGPTWCTLRVHEIQQERVLHHRFSGPEGFARHYDGEEPRGSRKIWSCRYVSVEAELLEHKIPVLAFRIQEKPHFAIDPQSMERLGLVPGPWIRELKKCVWKELPASHPSSEENSPQILYDTIRKDLPGASIGYLTDAGWTQQNFSRIEALMGDLTLLCAECTFLAADIGKARASYHLCAEDLNRLVTRLMPRYLLPMHLSKSYLRRTEQLYQELHPPSGTVILPLPNHVIPAPLTARDVEDWLRLPT